MGHANRRRRAAGELAVSDEQTLHEALLSLGLTSRPAAEDAPMRQMGRREIVSASTGESLGWFNATEGWDLVHALGR